MNAVINTSPDPTPPKLPVLHVEVTGQVTASNLEAYRSTALAMFAAINTNLQTDDDFSDADDAAKWCGDIESKLADTKQRIADEMTRLDRIKTDAAEAALATPVATVEVAPIKQPLAAPVVQQKPIASAPTAITSSLTRLERPSDAQIVGVLALHYRVHESRIVAWLLAMDLTDPELSAL